MVIFYGLKIGESLDTHSKGESSNSDQGSSEQSEIVLTIVTKDGTSTNENDVTKYSVEKYDYGTVYLMKDDAKCVEVQKAGNQMWNQGSGNDKVKAIYIDETLSIAIIAFDNGKHIGYGFTDTECNLIAEKDFGDFPDSDFEFTLINGSNEEKASENDYKKVDYGYGIDYILNRNVKCVKVKHKGNSVWEKGDQDVNEDPIKISVNRFNKFIFINFQTLYLSYKFDNVWTFVTKSDFAPLEYSKFKFVTVDSNGDNSSEQDDRFNKTGNDDLTLKTNDGFKFEEIKYENKKVWKHAEDTSSKNRPGKIVLKLKSRCVWIYFSCFDFRVYKYINKSWKLVWSLETGRQ
ncbi:hypothetical protein MACK_000566 [Theileria orientalis]|uniref:Uncharacterized protein n=1 Tax=Theileria orientalis TaxID=68886 RepID=A0A976QU30_THEOR|nr:hypothetical protein MACK_000566 [Theileria orientalis]